MIDLRKLVIVVLIAILFSVFVFSTIDAIYPSPDYEDYCSEEPRMPKPITNEDGCVDLSVPAEAYETCEGYIAYRNGPDGCATEWYCETCNLEYNAARDVHQRYIFYISAVLALIAIFIGLYLPAKQNTLNEWIGTGFLLGGAFVLIFGTIQGFESLHRFIKPVIMLLELLLVIFLAYKKIGNLKS